MLGFSTEGFRKWVSKFHNRAMPNSTQITRYIDVQAMSALVQRVGLRSMIRQLVEDLRTDFLNWNDFEKSPRTANHCALGVLELMPISNSELFSFKYVNGHPKNPQQGLSTVMAFGALAKMSTGYPMLVSEMTILTAIRTAATSVLAASVLARPDSRVMAMIGNGAQSEFQLIAFHEMLGVSEFRLYDVDPEATAKLMRNMGHHPELKLTVCNSAAEAAAGADIITTCTADKTNATILTDSMIQPGVHINGIGGDCPGKTELEAAILNRAMVVVEFEPQSRIEGELQQMPADFEVTELWRILDGEVPGRNSADEITLFDSVGFALEDFSALRMIERLARQHPDLGQTLEIMPKMSDVKDLFGMIEPVPATVI